MTDSLSRSWLPFAPLLRFKPKQEFKEDRDSYAGVWGMGTDRLEQAWYRAEKRGQITRAAADDICVNVLHRHPDEVFGSQWWEG